MRSWVQRNGPERIVTYGQTSPFGDSVQFHPFICGLQYGSMKWVLGQLVPFILILGHILATGHSMRNSTGRSWLPSLGAFPCLEIRISRSRHTSW